MAEPGDFKIKGITDQAAKEDVSKEAVQENTKDSPDQERTPDDTNTSEDGEIEQNGSDIAAAIKTGEEKQQHEADLKQYRWCKCFCDPAQYGRDHYFLHMDTQVSKWEEPDQPYWLWDAENQLLKEGGLQYPKHLPRPTSSDGKDPNYTGYNPKIHGHYDPNADYARYHEKKREEEQGNVSAAPSSTSIPVPGMDYTAIGSFNRFTGNFQDADKSADRHNDFNKSGRQMGAYFDVDAAANAHDGRSLKEERRNEKLSKKQIKELAEKRRAKKEKKRMDFYKS